MKKQIAVLSLLISVMGWAQEDKPQTPKKEKEIKEVTITKTKKAVEQKADRTIFDFLNSRISTRERLWKESKNCQGLSFQTLQGWRIKGKCWMSIWMGDR